MADALLGQLRYDCLGFEREKLRIVAPVAVPIEALCFIVSKDVCSNSDQIKCSNGIFILSLFVLESCVIIDRQKRRLNA
jgi:hypothetical protein